MFWRRNREKDAAKIYDVTHVEKIVDSVGKIHIPKEFRTELGIESGTVVDLALFPGSGEIRIQRKRKEKDAREFP